LDITQAAWICTPVRSAAKARAVEEDAVRLDAGAQAKRALIAAARDEVRLAGEDAARVGHAREESERRA
jgi:hypothetical protein